MQLVDVVGKQVRPLEALPVPHCSIDVDAAPTLAPAGTDAGRAAKCSLPAHCTVFRDGRSRRVILHRRTEEPSLGTYHVSAGCNAVYQEPFLRFAVESGCEHRAGARVSAYHGFPSEAEQFRGWDAGEPDSQENRSHE